MADSLISYTIPEIFQQISDAKTVAEKHAILGRYRNNAFEKIIEFSYHPRAKFTLPEGVPVHRPSQQPLGYQHTTLLAEARRLYVFVKELSPNLEQKRREMKFIETLESLHPTESTFLIWMKNGEIESHYPGIDYDMLRNYYLDKKGVPYLLPVREKKAVPFREVEPTTTLNDVVPEEVKRPVPPKRPTK
jgi:hypothetical protein